ncbi:MAG: M28 family peptidase [Bacteroidales bacterium]|jgi:Zn-dependent M28 family amino/carboxypeptidase|nr:M28 family peptidase [Bacteroidales bacterium]
MNFRIYVFILAFLLVVCVSCGTPAQSDAEATPTTETKITLPAFEADSAYQFAARQLAFGPRVPGTKAHQQCATYLEQTISAYADKVEVQAFSTRVWNGEMKSGKNIIASFFPENRTRILLAAHWDSRPTADHDPDERNWHKPVPGANDGASGVAVLLEIARQFSIQKPDIGVDIIFFDLEDYGTPEFATDANPDTWCLGTQHWAENPHKIGYKAYYGILLDMVGCGNPRFTKEGTSMYYASDIVSKVWTTAQTLGFGSAFVNDQTNAIVDDHLYVNQLTGIPMIDIIQYDHSTGTGFYPYWHTVQDDLSKIDKRTMQIVGQTVLAQIYQE